MSAAMTFKFTIKPQQTTTRILLLYLKKPIYNEPNMEAVKLYLFPNITYFIMSLSLNPPIQ